ncbi:MAG: ribosome biogenesis GTP-binding protein YihA/YsxC [Gammaproteobacteria bacterium]
MKLNIPYLEARLILSARTLEQCPADRGAEVAFAGYSNTGKSSVINAITGRHGLARAAKAPGRTRLLNFFSLGPERRLVDLPGYGYARVPEELKQQWEETISRYLENRRSLLGLMLVMDVRHPLKKVDLFLLDWCRDAGLPVHVLLNKADKLSHAEGVKVLQKVGKQAGVATVQLFSARARSGVQEARKRLEGWFKQAWGQA